MNQIKVNKKSDTDNTYKLSKILISATTGEIEKYIHENEKLIIKTPKSVLNEDVKKYINKRGEWNNFKEVLNNECGTFYFNFFKNGLYDIQIKESIKARFLFLYTYVSYSDRGAYLLNGNNKPMKSEDIFKKLNLSERRFKDTMDTLISNRLIIKEGNKFRANTILASRGEISEVNNDLEYARMFDNGIRSLYNNCSSTQHKQLYYLFRLLPYINKTYNAICKNPNEIEASKVIPLTLKEICNVIGYDEKNASRFKREMYKLKVFDQYAMLGIESLNGKWYKINPRVLYAGNEESINSFMDLLSNDFRIK